MSSVWFADISMESLPGPRPVRPTVSLRPSMACFRQQSARLVDMHALKPCARSCFSLPENLTSPRSTRMPAEPHYPLSFQKSLLFSLLLQRLALEISADCCFSSRQHVVPCPRNAGDCFDQHDKT